MNDEQILEKVKAFADRAHGEQLRRYSKDRYIVHPTRVMGIVENYISDLPVRAAALLHDVLEDTAATSDQIREFLKPLMSRQDVDRTLQLVEELTDVFVKKKFPKMNRQTRRFKEGERLATASPEAQTIKYADILDNAVDIYENDLDFALVYLRECKDLLQQMATGNVLLRKRVTDEINDLLQKYFRNANITAL